MAGKQEKIDPRINEAAARGQLNDRKYGKWSQDTHTRRIALGGEAVRGGAADREKEVFAFLEENGGAQLVVVKSAYSTIEVKGTIPDTCTDSAQTERGIHMDTSLPRRGSQHLTTIADAQGESTDAAQDTQHTVLTPNQLGQPSQQPQSHGRNRRKRRPIHAAPVARHHPTITSPNDTGPGDQGTIPAATAEASDSGNQSPGTLRAGWKELNGFGQQRLDREAEERARMAEENRRTCIAQRLEQVSDWAYEGMRMALAKKDRTARIDIMAADHQATPGLVMKLGNEMNVMKEDFQRQLWLIRQMLVPLVTDSPPTRVHGDEAQHNSRSHQVKPGAQTTTPETDKATEGAEPEKMEGIDHGGLGNSRHAPAAARLRKQEKNQAPAPMDWEPTQGHEGTASKGEQRPSPPPGAPKGSKAKRSRPREGNGSPGDEHMSNDHRKDQQSGSGHETYGNYNPLGILKPAARLLLGVEAQTLVEGSVRYILATTRWDGDESEPRETV
ncbi:hypothetical protein BDZ91DRAFT_802679 [Kalaharituber pfeilii]|nr:hypothetical protein BDZ91DRAFT_802679 [Kalaharituber pfeilii]